MEDSAPQIDSEENEHAVTEADAMAELRRLVVGPERAQLVKLQERINDPAFRVEDVSRVLPEAIIARSRQNGDLASALSSTISEAIKTSVKKDPQPLVDAMFPVIGPAIRRAISDALGRMMQSLNQTIEYSLSAKSWRWRLEARRTGKSFAEVVLLHTLVYRVEQLFLIDRKTGLLLVHLKADSVAAQDADMVSGMLIAVQDFVSDSFGGNGSQPLDELRVGERTVWVVHGPQAVVAAAIWGIPHLDLKARMQEVCERIHREQASALAAFKGDTAPFEPCRPCLEECLVQASRGPADASETPKDTKRLRMRLAVTGAIIAVALSIWLFFSIRQRNAFNDYVADLKARPGITVISTGRQGGKYALWGLRDPMADDPDAVLVKHPRLAKTNLIAHWQPYQSLSPAFVLARVRSALGPPPTVTLSFSDGTLYARGMASAAWIADAQRLVPMFPGVASFDSGNLTALDETAKLLRKANDVLVPPETVQLAFSNGLLSAKGSAPTGWVENARRLSILIPGVSRWHDDVSEIDPPPERPTTVHALLQRVDALEKVRGIRFNDFFDVDPMPGQEKLLDVIADDIKSLIDSAERAQMRVRVDVVGHTDSLGIDQTRAQVSQQRAERVVGLLVLRDIPRGALYPVGAANHDPIDGGNDDSLNRRVSFRIEFLASHP